MADKLPGGGLFGWLGRQFGYVKKAIKTDVTSPQQPAPPAKAQSPKVVFRANNVQEAPMPGQPNMKLRRTVIDEVIVNDRPKDGTDQPPK